MVFYVPPWQEGKLVFLNYYFYYPGFYYYPDLFLVLRYLDQLGDVAFVWATPLRSIFLSRVDLGVNLGCSDRLR